MITAGYAILAILGVMTFTDLMWFALIFEVFHGHGAKALFILILIIFFGD